MAAAKATRHDESSSSSSPPLRCNDDKTDVVRVGRADDDDDDDDNVWWLRMTCFFFFAGLSCYVPFLAAHLQWIGLNLQEIGIINLTAGLGSSFGLLLANIWSSSSSSGGRRRGRRRRNCGHRSNLALVVLLAAFCGAGLILVPRISERNNNSSLYGGRSTAVDRDATERPLAEILCRPEGSALFFRKCGDSCELDAVTRTELVVSDCRFESQNRFPGNFLDWINRFALMNPGGGLAGADDDADKSDGPERGDLPQKQPPVPSSSDQPLEWQPDDPQEEEEDDDDIASLFGGQNPALTSSSSSAASGGSGNIDPYEYDYDENHRQDAAAETETEQQQNKRRRRRHIRRVLIINNNDDDGKGVEEKKKKTKKSVANEEEDDVSDEDSSSSSNHLHHHRDEQQEQERRRGGGVVGDDINVDASLSHHLEGIELEMAEKSELPYISSPHICFSSHLLSTTTCHVFTGNNHLFRFNTSFYSSITHNGQCFYSLNYDDVDNQILSELRCRSNKPNHQVRCRAEGVKLRASVTERRNGTNGECNRASSSSSSTDNGNFHVSFWLYLVFRTCGEAAVIGSVLLLRIVTLTADDKLMAKSSTAASAVSSSLMLLSTVQRQQQQQPTDRTDRTDGVKAMVKWWMWGLFGFVIAGPIAGLVADKVGFGIAFLLGSVMFALAAFCIALAPSQQPPKPRRSTIPGLEQEEDDEEDENGILQLGSPQDDRRHRAAAVPHHRIAARDLVALVSNKTSLLILFFILFMGMSAATVPTSLYWYILDLGASRFQLGLVVSPALIVAPFVLLLSRWLWKRCGHRYIFIIGLLLYSIRFLGYSLLHRPLWLIAMETMEPLCSVWMLLTAAARIQQLEFHSQMAGKHGAIEATYFSSSSSSPLPLRSSSWKINTWALIIVFHYSFGRGIGGGLSSLAAHHFGVIRVFVGAALVSLFTAACWFLWIHLKPPDKTSFLCNTKNAQPNKQQLPTTTTTTSSRLQPKKNTGTAAAVSQPITTGQSPLPSSQQKPPQQQHQRVTKAKPVEV